MGLCLQQCQYLCISSRGFLLARANILSVTRCTRNPGFTTKQKQINPSPQRVSINIKDLKDQTKNNTNIHPCSKPCDI